MILLFKQEISKLTANTSVYNEQEETVYSLKTHMGFRHKKDLLDADENIIAKIAKDGIAGHKHTIEMDGTKYHVKRCKERSFNHFEVTPLGWTVTCTHMGGEFRIVDRDGNVIAEKNESNAIFGFGKFGMEVKADEDAPLAVAVYFAVMDIIIMEDVYIHSATSF